MKVVRRLAWFILAAVALGCGGESTRPSSPQQNMGGAAGETSGTTGATEPMCTGAQPDPDPDRVWANWPMPHPPSSGLPNPARYDISQSDVVIDEVTGLMWSQDASPVDEELSFEAAVAHCADLETGDHCDWRLPTRIELVSLVDFTRQEPAIAREVFSDFPEPQERVGWSFFTTSSNESSQWQLVFLKGTSVPMQPGSALQGSRARCVRLHAESEPPESRYVIEGQAPDDIVTDRGTGLSWQRRPGEQTFPFSEAQAYCTSLTLQGAGWRLPSMKELQTIVDESRQSPALDPEIFPDFPTSPDAFFRTSSPSAECSDCAWLMRPDGSVFETGVNTELDAHHHVRCVRSVAGQ